MIGIHTLEIFEFGHKTKEINSFNTCWYFECVTIEYYRIKLVYGPLFRIVNIFIFFVEWFQFIDFIKSNKTDDEEGI